MKHLGFYGPKMIVKWKDINPIKIRSFGLLS